MLRICFACQLHAVFANPTCIAADTPAITFPQAISMVGKENYDSLVDMHCAVWEDSSRLDKGERMMKGKVAC
jgi:hypothetical protein